MKKIIFLLIFVLSFLSQANAQLLWKIDKKGVSKPSYLFGTHHLIPVSFLYTIPGLFKAFNECDVVIGEMVLNNIDATEKIQQAALLPKDSTMSTIMSEENYSLVDHELRATLGLGLKEMSMLNPSFIRTMYELEIYNKTTGSSEEDMLSDSYFQMAGEQKGKKIVGLEDIDKQIDILLGNKDLRREAQLLAETVRNKEEIVEGLITLNELYKAGEIEKLVELAKVQENFTDMTDEEYAIMVDNRNFAWVEILPDYINQSPCFIAVGALHLGGENGLINLLKKQGYKITPVK